MRRPCDSRGASTFRAQSRPRIAEVGSAEKTCLIPDREPLRRDRNPSRSNRIVERHGHLRGDPRRRCFVLPRTCRPRRGRRWLGEALRKTLTGIRGSRAHWLAEPRRAARIRAGSVRREGDRDAVQATFRTNEVCPLVRHLRGERPASTAGPRCCGAACSPATSRCFEQSLAEGLRSWPVAAASSGAG